MSFRELMNRWFFAPEDPYPYALFRIGIGLTALLQLLSYLPYVSQFYSDHGYYPRSAMAVVESAPNPVSFYLLSGSPGWAWVCFLATLLLALAFTLGYRTRWVTPLLWFSLLSLVNRNLFATDGVYVLLVQLLLPLSFVDTGAVLSLDARRRGAEEPPAIEAWIGRLLRLQFCIVYFWSGLYKLMGAAWTDGSAVKLALANPAWRRFDMSWFLSQGWFDDFLGLFSCVTPWWELSFPLLVLLGPLRWAAVGFGVFLHGSQFLTISTGFFATLMLSFYFLYIPPRFCRRLVGRPAEEAPSI